jgi:hypothetical protein
VHRTRSETGRIRRERVSMRLAPLLSRAASKRVLHPDELRRVPAYRYAARSDPLAAHALYSALSLSPSPWFWPDRSCSLTWFATSPLRLRREQVSRILDGAVLQIARWNKDVYSQMKEPIDRARAPEAARRPLTIHAPLVHGKSAHKAPLDHHVSRKTLYTRHTNSATRDQRVPSAPCLTVQ